MKVKRLLLICVILGFYSNLSFGQAEQDLGTETGLEGGSIGSQFQYIIDKSNRYQDYKVIKQDWIEKLQDNVQDSIKSAQKAQRQAEQNLANSKLEITTLQNKIKSLDKNIAAVNEDKENISVMGFGTDKLNFKLIAGAIVLLLLGLVMYYGFMFKRSNDIRKSAKGAADLVQYEFDEYKKRTMKKEQEIMRKLQDEINKNSG